MGTFISCSRVGVPLGPFPSPPQLRVGEQSKQMQPHPSLLLLQLHCCCGEVAAAAALPV